MNLREHLDLLVRYAPSGTLVPVDCIAELLQTYPVDVEPEREENAALARPSAGLSLGEIAERFTRVVDGEAKTVQEGTVRKWVRVGLCGVKLRAFRAGRHLRVLEEEFERFVRDLAAARGPGSQAERNPVLAPLSMSQVDAAATVDAFTEYHRHPQKPRGAARPRERSDSSVRVKTKRSRSA